MLQLEMPPINRDLGRRTASVCQLWSAEPDLPVHARRSKSALPVFNKAALSAYANSLPISRDNSFGSRRKSQTLLQDPCIADDAATADICAAAELACDGVDVPEPNSGIETPVAAHANSISVSVTSTGNTAADATATITVSAVKPILPVAANTLAARQKWRSAQPDWGTCTRQHETLQTIDPEPTVSTQLLTQGSLQYDPKTGESSVFHFDRSGPLVAAVARLQEACMIEGVQLQLPFRVLDDLQRLRRRAAYVKAAAARLQEAPLTAETAAAAAAAAERDRFIWSVPELEQVLWLLASAYQRGTSVVQKLADELRLAFQKQCRVWDWSARCPGPLVPNAVADNLYTATMRVLRELSNSKQLCGPLWNCRPSAKALIPIMQVQLYLIQNQSGYHKKILQLQPRRWNALGATRMDWTTEPKHLDIVELTNAVMALVWKAEYVPAFQLALDMVRAIALAVEEQLRPETEAWDRMAVQYCNRLNGLKLKPLYAKGFPLQKKMMRVVDRARAGAKVGEYMDTGNEGRLWPRVKLFLGLV